jgi:hypothetical protein
MALEYRRHGWSIIPIAAGTKKPPKRFRWKRFQKRLPTEEEVREWFSHRDDLGLAVIFGEVSGGLVCRDFDEMQAYERWAAEHPDLAATLPTVATPRPGRHVYSRSNECSITKLPDGELRGGGYCLLPPSPHPNGQRYEWLIPLPDGPLPFIEDVRAAGFLDGTPNVTERTERTETTEENGGEPRRTEAMDATALVSSRTESKTDLPHDIAQAMRETLPTGPGRRNRQVFELARALKAIPRLADAPVDTLEPYVRRWHEVGVAKKLIATEPFEETWIDFLHAWPRVKYAKGDEPMVVILEKAKQQPLPQAASKYEQPQLRLLVALCRQLQAASGQQPFFLSCRTAARLLDVDHVKAWRWLFLLVHRGDLEEVEKGKRGKRRASRYRYLGD